MSEIEGNQYVSPRERISTGAAVALLGFIGVGIGGGVAYAVYENVENAILRIGGVGSGLVVGIGATAFGAVGGIDMVAGYFGRGYWPDGAPVEDPPPGPADLTLIEGDGGPLGSAGFDGSPPDVA